MAMEVADEGRAAAAESPIKHRGWKTMPFLIGNETFEKLGALGTASNLMVYLTAVFHLSSVSAATTLNMFNGTTNLATVFGAFLSDSYFGRYATVGFGSLACLVGMIIIMLTAAISKLHPPHCDPGQLCEGPTAAQHGILITAFACLVIGSGAIRPCNLPFGADQFDQNTESGRKGIHSFFNWYYFSFTIAVGISSTVIIYIQSNVSWGVGYAIPAILMLVSCMLFFMGSNLYVKVKPEGSPFTSVVQVIVAAFTKRGLKLPDDPKSSLFDPPHASSVVSKLPYTNQFRCLDKASIKRDTDEVKPNGSAANPWSLCSIQQVEEVKCIIRVIPIWASGWLYYIAIAQQQTYVVLQALQSDRRIGNSKFEIPAASFTIFPMIALTVWIPVYDGIVVPLLRKVNKKEEGMTLLQKMGIGMILSIAAMLISGAIEVRRRNYARYYPMIGTAQGGGGISSMSSFWLVPQLSLLGFSEAFNLVSQLEFYYRQFPENMRSVAGSLLFCGIAISSYMSGFLVTVVNGVTSRGGRNSWLAEDLNKGKLDYYYYLIAVMGAVNLVYFLVWSKWYKYKGFVAAADHLERDRHKEEEA